MLSAQLKSKRHFKECLILRIFLAIKEDISFFVNNYEDKSTKEFETLLTNIEDLDANISCGNLKLMLMISNFNDSSSCFSIHEMIVPKIT